MKQRRWFLATAMPALWMVVAALLLLLMPTAASAATCSGSFGTNNLGTYNGTLLSVGTTLGSITCPQNFSYRIGLSARTGSGTTVTLRKMTGPNAATLSYKIFQDSAYTVNWGNTSGVDTKSGVGTGGAQSVPVYSQIPANQHVAPGTYQDTITLTVFNTSPLTTRTFGVVAVVQAACTISATPLAFGNYAGVQKDTTATLTATCTNTTPYNIGLSVGQAPGATVNTRAMTGPSAAMLNYAIFRDSTRSINWGNTVGTDTLVGQGTGSVQSLTVYGRIPAGQSPRPGSYADTVIATITY
jgi:spore coat protein U-like protein